MLRVDRNQLGAGCSRAAAGPPVRRRSGSPCSPAPRRLPARSVSIVTGNPAKPTTPFIDDVGGLHEVGEIGDDLDRVTGEGRRRPAARAASSLTATTLGCSSRACSTTVSAEAPTPSATTSYRSPPSARTTSIVCVPIEPDEPAIATRIGLMRTPASGGLRHLERSVRLAAITRRRTWSTVRAPASGSRRREARTGTRRTDRARHRGRGRSCRSPSRRDCA